MIKVLKKNQIVFATLGLTLIVAGYLNYASTPELKYQTELTGNIEENLGENIYVSDEIIPDSVPVASLEEVKGTDEYFINARIKRDNMFDEQIDTYKEIMENSAIPTEQKNNAQINIEKINKIKNSISISESLILLKNVEDVVIMTSGKSINVVVKSENELDSDKVAQMYSIISREMETDISNIQIMLKK